MKAAWRSADGDHNHRGQKVRDVGQVVPIERLLQRAHFIRPGDQEVEEGDEGALKLSPLAGVDGQPPFKGGRCDTCALRWFARRCLP